MASHNISRRRLIGSLPAALILLAVPAAAQPADKLPDLLRPMLGHWLAEEIDGSEVDAYVRSTLVVQDNGSVSGMGGCNRFRGLVGVEHGQIRFNTRSLVTTLKACETDFSRQDSKFHEALERTRSFTLQPQDHKLILLDHQGRPVMRLAAM